MFCPAGPGSGNLPGVPLSPHPGGRLFMSQRRVGAVAVLCLVCGGVLGWLVARAPAPNPASAATAQAPAADAPHRSAPPEDGKLRVICFGAHPDDCELKAAGVAALWAAKGHHVKFVSVT